MNKIELCDNSNPFNFHISKHIKVNRASVNQWSFSFPSRAKERCRLLIRVEWLRNGMLHIKIHLAFKKYYCHLRTLYGTFCNEIVRNQASLSSKSWQLILEVFLGILSRLPVLIKADPINIKNARPLVEGTWSIPVSEWWRRRQAFAGACRSLQELGWYWLVLLPDLS